MKRILSLLVLLGLVLLSCTPATLARAGGGSGSAGKGGGSSHSSRGSSGRTHHGHYYGPHHTPHGANHYSIQSIIMLSSSIISIVYIIVIFKKRHLIKAKLKTRYGMMKNKIDYKSLNLRVQEAYFAIQKSWANGEMTQASKFMVPELIESFNLKLKWLNFSNKRNIMKKIKLIDEYPISFDYKTKDKMWVYIKGKMVDYTIDFEKNEIISGANTAKSFVEYWLFIKNENDEWVLSKILQKDDFNKLIL